MFYRHFENIYEKLGQVSTDSGSWLHGVEVSSACRWQCNAFYQICLPEGKQRKKTHINVSRL